MKWTELKIGETYSISAHYSVYPSNNTRNNVGIIHFHPKDLENLTLLNIATDENFSIIDSKVRYMAQCLMKNGTIGWLIITSSTIKDFVEEYWSKDLKDEMPKM